MLHQTLLEFVPLRILAAVFGATTLKPSWNGTGHCNSLSKDERRTLKPLTLQAGQETRPTSFNHGSHSVNVQDREVDPVTHPKS
jgi:hypothetical protein